MPVQTTSNAVHAHLTLKREKPGHELRQIATREGQHGIVKARERVPACARVRSNSQVSFRQRVRNDGLGFLSEMRRHQAATWTSEV